jgi:hypothetical protein
MDIHQVYEISLAADRIAKAGAIVKRNIKLRRFSNEDDKMFNDVSSMESVPPLTHLPCLTDH